MATARNNMGGMEDQLKKSLRMSPQELSEDEGGGSLKFSAPPTTTLSPEQLSAERQQLTAEVLDLKAAMDGSREGSASYKRYSSLLQEARGKLDRVSNQVDDSKAPSAPLTFGPKNPNGVTTLDEEVPVELDEPISPSPVGSLIEDDFLGQAIAAAQTPTPVEVVEDAYDNKVEDQLKALEDTTTKQIAAIEKTDDGKAGQLNNELAKAEQDFKEATIRLAEKKYLKDTDLLKIRLKKELDEAEAHLNDLEPADEVAVEEEPVPEGNVVTETQVEIPVPKETKPVAVETPTNVEAQIAQAEQELARAEEGIVEVKGKGLRAGDPLIAIREKRVALAKTKLEALRGTLEPEVSVEFDEGAYVVEAKRKAASVTNPEVAKTLIAAAKGMAEKRPQDAAGKVSKRMDEIQAEAYRNRLKELSKAAEPRTTEPPATITTTEATPTVVAPIEEVAPSAPEKTPTPKKKVGSKEKAPALAQINAEQEAFEQEARGLDIDELVSSIKETQGKIMAAIEADPKKQNNAESMTLLTKVLVMKDRLTQIKSKDTRELNKRKKRAKELEHGTDSDDAEVKQNEDRIRELERRIVQAEDGRTLGNLPKEVPVVTEKKAPVREHKVTEQSVADKQAAIEAAKKRIGELGRNRSSTDEDRAVQVAELEARIRSLERDIKDTNDQERWAQNLREVIAEKQARVEDAKAAFVINLKNIHPRDEEVKKLVQEIKGKEKILGSLPDAQKTKELERLAEYIATKTKRVQGSITQKEIERMEVDRARKVEQQVIRREEKKQHEVLYAEAQARLKVAEQTLAGLEGIYGKDGSVKALVKDVQHQKKSIAEESRVEKKAALADALAKGTLEEISRIYTEAYSKELNKRFIAERKHLDSLRKELNGIERRKLKHPKIAELKGLIQTLEEENVHRQDEERVEATREVSAIMVSEIENLKQFEQRTKEHQRLLEINKAEYQSLRELLDVLSKTKGGTRAEQKEREEKILTLEQQVRDTEESIRTLEAGEVSYGTSESEALWKSNFERLAQVKSNKGMTKRAPKMAEKSLGVAFKEAGIATEAGTEVPKENAQQEMRAAIERAGKIVEENLHQAAPMVEPVVAAAETPSAIIEPEPTILQEAEAAPVPEADPEILRRNIEQFLPKEQEAVPNTPETKPSITWGGVFRAVRNVVVFPKTAYDFFTKDVSHLPPEVWQTKETQTRGDSQGSSSETKKS